MKHGLASVLREDSPSWTYRDHPGSGRMKLRRGITAARKIHGQHLSARELMAMRSNVPNPYRVKQPTHD